ncbi:adenylate cyclase, terminal-differentiation specific-like isoform X1 [Anopheles albimanus]|uniref:Uncharacterized protein n=1 Tax=Anopheles albimanus TaxID=7167 RepID=A0A182FFB1_ANOAL|nr:adenylate cyclase, terminal-differentiation specific-like isoform X1 [Anopheles albimanus]
MEEQNDGMLEALVDEAIGLPDGIINCTELNRLLKELVARIIELQRAEYEERLCAVEEALALLQQKQETVVVVQGQHTEPMVTTEEEAQNLVQSSSVASMQEEKNSLAFSQSQVSQKEHHDQSECSEESLKEKFELLDQSDQSEQTEQSEQPEQPEQPEQSEQSEQPSTNLATFMKELQDRIQHVEQLFSAKLDSLTNDFTQFQQTLNQGKQLKHTSDELTFMTTMLQQPPVVPSTEQLNKVAEFSAQLEDLQRELERLKGDRDRLPAQIESLVQDKLKQCEVMAGAKKAAHLSVYTEASSSRMGTLTTKTRPKPTVSASCTTQELLQNLTCLSCDTKNVIQRMRNGGRYLTPRSSAKLALAARRLGCSDSDVRQQALPTNVLVGRSRKCGGAYTVVQPEERVFRTVSGQILSEESIHGDAEEAADEQEQ